MSWARYCSTYRPQRRTAPVDLVNDKAESRYNATATFTATRTRGATVTRYVNERTGFAVGVDAGRRTLGRAGGAIGRAWRAVAETVSPVGWLLLCVGACGLIAGLRWGWAEAWVVAIASLTLLLIAVPFMLGKSAFTVALEFDRDRVVAGAELSAQLGVVNQGEGVALPVLLDIPVGKGLVEAHVPLLRPGATHMEDITISAPKRGIITVGPMTIGRGDPLGVFRRDHTWPGVQTIYVHPVTAVVPSASAGLMRDIEGAVTKTIVDSDLSFHAIRDYVPGDARRSVHWRSTAKTGDLMVRQYEETRRSRIAIVMDLGLACYTTDAEFELGVSAASSLGLQAVREGREVVIAASAEIPEHARGAVHSIRWLPTLTPRAMLDAMSAVEASEHVMGLEQVCAMTSQEVPQLSLVFLVTGATVPMKRLRQSAVAFPADVTVVAVRCEPGSEPTVKTARELRVMTIGMLHDLGHLMVRASA